MVGTHINKSNERSGSMEPFRAAMSYEVSRTCNSYCTSDMQLSQNFSWLEAIQVADMSYNLNIQDYEKIDEVERKKFFFFFKKKPSRECLFVPIWIWNMHSSHTTVS